MKSNPYLHFNGNCEKAVNFYVRALGAKTIMLMRYSEAPQQCENGQATCDKIMHARLTLGDGVIMASDCPPEHYEKPAGFSVSINVETPEEGERLFKALSENGSVRMPYGETFWARGFGMVIDQFDIPWMVNCEKKG